MTTTDDDYCELHRFHEVGRVSSDVGCFALIDIGAGHELTEWFRRIVDASGIRRPNPLTDFGSVATHEVMFDGWKGLGEFGVVVNAEQGSYRVFARFCDYYGTGHMSVCELRVLVHDHDGDHQDDETDA